MKYILILAHLCLLAAGYSVFFNQWIPPRIFPYFSLLSLGFPIIIAAHIFMLLFWWVYRWKIAVFFTIISVFLAIPLNKVYHFYGESEASESNLKLITYNVQYFTGKSDDLVNFLKKEQADVFFLQEVGPGMDYFIKNAAQDEPYYFQDYNSLAIASKYPIIETQKFRMKPYPNTYAYADMALPNDTVRFITFYLESLHIDQGRIKSTTADTDHIKRNARSLAAKVVKASKIHQKQIDAINDNVKSSPHPVVLCGDMNAVPSSYEYYALRRGAKDAFLYGDKGFGSTFPGFKTPLRLDYVFVPQDFKITSHRIDNIDYSDHFPVIVEMLIP